jgi:hypothetical protein
MGLEKHQIKFVHDATTETQRELLFNDCRNGEVSVLIGSTFKMGTGVNVQKRLVAIHHLDVPWRPADMVQREGRILRQGNLNDKVQIFRYITKESFDAYSWQLLETKQRFINALLSGSMTERSGKDVDDTVLNYAEVKALAIGNPLIKERVATANELGRFIALQRKTVEARHALERRLLELPNETKRLYALAKKARADRDFYDANKREYEQEERRDIRARIYDAVKDNHLQLQERTLLTYQGFEVILPANMLSEKPFVWLKREGRYYVELGEGDRGVLIRIDNALDGLNDIFMKHYANYRELQLSEARMKEELAKNENYVDKIEELREKLKKLDEKLGVNKQ